MGSNNIIYSIQSKGNCSPYGVHAEFSCPPSISAVWDAPP